MKKIIAILLMAVSLLILTGITALFSYSVTQPRPDRFYQHLRWIAVGLTFLTLIAMADYRWLRKWRLPWWLFALAVSLLVLVFVPGLGVNKNGAFRWLPVGQPSEFAKIALIIFLADYAATQLARMREFTVGFVRPCAFAGLIMLLVFREPDWGCATLLAVLTLAMLGAAGGRGEFLLAAVAAGGALFHALLVRNPLRMERMLAFRDPEKYRDGVGWQGWHSLLALGSGGWLGTWFAEGSQKYGFVPEQETDFVLSLIGEEMGLVGTLLVLGLFVVIVLCGARIAGRTADPFGRLLAFGITFLIGIQALINIAVVTSSVPNKGIALPFVSYGGSNIVIMLGCVGLLVSVARHAPLASEAGPEAENPRLPVPIGPVGSLLYGSMARSRKGMRAWFVRWMHGFTDAKFPARPRHPYQEFPRRTGK